MTHRYRAPDGLVHDAVQTPKYVFARTICERRYGDMWSKDDLVPSKDVTTCLRCLAEPDRSHLPAFGGPY